LNEEEGDVGGKDGLITSRNDKGLRQSVRTIPSSKMLERSGIVDSGRKRTEEGACREEVNNKYPNWAKMFRALVLVVGGGKKRV